MKTTYKLIGLLGGFLLLGDCFLPPAAAEPYLIQPDDTLEIKVWRHPDLDTEVTVGENGTINLPLIGKVQAAQKTPEALEDSLTELWSGDFLKNPYVSVSVLNKRFFVLGEVGQPGAHDMEGNITILKALSMSGGLGPYASQGSIYILRQDENGIRRIDVDVQDVRSGTTEDLQIRPGDIINVPQSLF